MVLLVLFLSEVVLDKQVAELVLEKVVALNLAAKVFPQLLVCKDELLHSTLLLIIIDFAHLSAMKRLLKALNLTAQACSLLGSISITNLVTHVLVLLAKGVHLNFLLIDDSSQRVNYSLKLCDGLQLAVPKLDRVALVRELLTCNLLCLFLDSSKFFFSLILQVGRNLRTLQLVLLQVGDTLL